MFAKEHAELPNYIVPVIGLCYPQVQNYDLLKRPKVSKNPQIPIGAPIIAQKWSKQSSKPAKTKSQQTANRITGPKQNSKQSPQTSSSPKKTPPPPNLRVFFLGFGYGWFVLTAPLTVSGKIPGWASDVPPEMASWDFNHLAATQDMAKVGQSFFFW